MFIIKIVIETIYSYCINFQIAAYFYNTKLKMELVREEMVFDTYHVSFQVEFDNKSYDLRENLFLARDEMNLPLKGDIIFEFFPFSILFG